MARIPTPAQRGQEVGSVQSQFTPTPFQNLNPDADVFGAGQARAMKQASAGLDALSTSITKQAEEDDTLTLLTTQEQSGAFEIEVVNETLNQKQGNAIGASERAMERFAAYEASIKPASTQAGRLAQQRHLLQLKSSIASRSASHERDEVFKFKAGKVAGSIGTAQNRAGLNWNNPDIIKQSIEVVTAQTGNLADMKGVTDPEARSLAIKAEVSKAYMSALRGAVAGQDYTTAKKLLDTATEKDGLTAEDEQAALKLVQGATVQGESQSNADRIMATPGLDPEQRLEEARKTADSAIRAATVALVSGRNREAEDTKIRVKKERFQAAEAKAVQGIRPSLVDTEGLTATQIKHLYATAEYAKAEDRGENRQPPGEVDAVADFRKKSVVPDYLANVDLDDFAVEYEFEVSKPQYDLMVAEVVAAKQAANKLRASEARRLSEEQRNLKMAVGDNANLLRTYEAITGQDPKKGEGTKGFLAWQQEFNRRVIEQGATTPAERSDVINRMSLSRVKLTGTILGFGADTDDATAFNLDADDINKLARTLNVPKEMQPVFEVSYPYILTSIRLQKVPTTNASIDAEYKKMSSASVRLPANQRLNFTVNYANLTRMILRDGGVLSGDNYIKAWQQVSNGGR